MALQIPAPAEDLPASPLVDAIRASLIGDDEVMQGPFGPRRITYADYTASGRALEFIERFILEEVLPRYANTHTESSGTGLQTTRLREDARKLIREALGGDDDTCVIFCGSGSTAAIDRLIGVLNLRLPADLDHRYRLLERIPAEERPVVFIGPYEHHSNELPWRESIADVVVIPESADGHVDIGQLDEELQRFAERPLKIGSFSAASNVTGILTDTDAVTRLLHEHGALAFWDYAAAAPYVDIVMAPSGGDRRTRKDAVFISPHKFVGGPSTPGVLAADRHLFTNSVPDVVGGGTVVYVNPEDHLYVEDPEQREEAGTPAIVESIRAGLVFQLKQAVGTPVITALEHDFVHRAMTAWESNPAIDVLGSHSADRLSILSFVLRGTSGRYLHHNFVVAVLNDLFGIQSRGGCSCAGPYGHRLLGIDIERSHEFEREISRGCEGIKPGWVRVNFNYFISEMTFRYILDAVDLVARYGERLLPLYEFQTTTGLWCHLGGTVEPPLRLSDIHYDLDGHMRYPTHHDRAPESELTAYLQQARVLLESLPAPDLPSHVQGLSEDFEHLRWFDLARENVEGGRQASTPR